MNVIINNYLFSLSVYWQKVEGTDRYYYAYQNDELLLLRMNNFPDEPLYTLINKLEIHDLDDLPNSWVLPTNL